MAAKKGGARRRAPQPSAAGAAAPPVLPRITVAKLRETGLLLERLLQTNLSVFVDGGQRYREVHRDGTSRDLNAAEAVQLAVALSADDEVAAAEQLQQSQLRAYDEPDHREVLLAAGAATAPAFVAAACEFVALVEMPLDRFKQARESSTLPAAITADAAALDDLDLAEARRRASAAMAHYAAAAGIDSGNVWGLLIKTVTQALTIVVRQAGIAGASPSSQLTGSAASTDGDATTSSTSSPGTAPTEAPS